MSMCLSVNTHLLLSWLTSAQRDQADEVSVSTHLRISAAGRTPHYCSG